MTNKQKVKAHLKAGKTITGLTALKMFGCYRLSAVIHELRKEMKIKMALTGKKRYATYSVK